MQSLIKLTQLRIQGRAFLYKKRNFLTRWMTVSLRGTPSTLLVVKRICADSSLLLAVKKRTKPAKSAFTNKINYLNHNL